MTVLIRLPSQVLDTLSGWVDQIPPVAQSLR